MGVNNETRLVRLRVCICIRVCTRV
jgi:hypothetical protein